MNDDFLRDGTILDLSGITRYPLRFMFSKSSPPSNGQPESTTDSYGAVTNIYHWCIETANALGDKRTNQISGYLVMYVFPVADDVYLCGYSLGPLLDSVTRLMTNRHAGPKVTALIQKHWPTTFALLHSPTGFGILRVRTNADHWFVGDLVRSNTPGQMDLDEKTLAAIRDSAFVVVGDALGWPTNVPGLIETLGGIDPVAQRLDMAASVLGTAKDVADLAKYFLGMK